ncbi:MAG: hypothetical protein ACYTE2_04625, partial [Planctomycetota bacterium]
GDSYRVFARPASRRRGPSAPAGLRPARGVEHGETTQGGRSKKAARSRAAFEAKPPRGLEPLT